MNSIAQLVSKAQQATKTKLFDGYSRQSIKFYNGTVESVAITEDEFDELVKALRAAGFNLIPLVTSAGFQTTPPAVQQ